MILGLVKPTEGTALINKYDIVSQRKNAIEFVGAMVEAPSFYGYLSGYKNLKLYANLYQKDDNRINEVLELVGLSNAKNKKVSNYSLGMKQRLAIARAFLNNPKIVIFRWTNKWIRSTRCNRNKKHYKVSCKDRECNLYSLLSHFKWDQNLCNRISIINNGEILVEGNTERSY